MERRATKTIVPKLTGAVAAVALLVPAAAVAKQAPSEETTVLAAVNTKSAKADRSGDKRAEYERRYLKVRKDFVDRFGRQAAGRNLVRYGELDKDGDVRKAKKGEVVRSTERMTSSLAPPEPAASAAVETTETTETAATTETSAEVSGSGGAAASSSTAQCESGGDYGAVNSAGYYGAYQFDQSTWDAYAPEGYQGVNPAEAPPAVQDAAAANVDYDAWPNCP